MSSCCSAKEREFGLVHAYFLFNRTALNYTQVLLQQFNRCKETIIRTCQTSNPSVGFTCRVAHCDFNSARRGIFCEEIIHSGCDERTIGEQVDEQSPTLGVQVNRWEIRPQEDPPPVSSRKRQPASEIWSRILMTSVVESSHFAATWLPAEPM